MNPLTARERDLIKRESVVIEATATRIRVSGARAGREEVLEALTALRALVDELGFQMEAGNS